MVQLKKRTNQVGKYFTNKRLGARNILEIDLNLEAIAQSNIVKELTVTKNFSERSDYFSLRSPSWGGDMRWISSKSLDCHQEFNKCFDLIELPDLFKEIIEHSSRIVMYAGFLVERSASKLSYHTDWDEKVNNNAFTLLTPIHHPTDGIDLVYKDINGEEKKYEYKYGKAIIIGSELWHSTEPGRSCEATKLLCFQFGTDLKAFNRAIFNCMGTQSAFFSLPDGRYVHRKT